MTDLYSSTVPPAVLQKLRSTAPTSGWPRDAWIAEQAAQWGADQELEACCEWFADARNHGFGHDHAKIISTKIRTARRPRPLSLKAQALVALNKGCFPSDDEIATIRRALEALPE
jgi:hypothetical protein